MSLYVTDTIVKAIGHCRLNLKFRSKCNNIYLEADRYRGKGYKVVNATSEARLTPVEPGYDSFDFLFIAANNRDMVIFSNTKIELQRDNIFDGTKFRNIDYSDLTSDYVEMKRMNNSLAKAKGTKISNRQTVLTQEIIRKAVSSNRTDFEFKNHVTEAYLNKASLLGYEVIMIKDGSIYIVRNSKVTIFASTGTWRLPASCNWLFGRVVANKISFENVGTDNVKDTSGMFAYSDIKEVDLSNFKSKQVTNMNYMFIHSTIDKLIFGNFNTSSVKTMKAVFDEFKTKNHLDLSSFDTRNVVDMELICYATQAPSIDLSSFNISKVIKLTSAFARCEIPVVDLSKFAYDHQINIKGMLDESSSSFVNIEYRMYQELNRRSAK